MARHLFDHRDHPVVRVEGRDAIRFLHNMLSNDVSGLQDGQGRWATFNNAQGRTLSDVRLLRLGKKELLAILEPGARDAFVDGLDRFVISEKVFFEDAGLELAVVVGDELTDLAPDLPAPGLLNHGLTTIGGAEVRVVWLDRSGREARDLGLLFAPPDGDAVRAALGLEAGDPDALEAARIEAGQPRFGIDFTEENIPLEAGLKDRAISFTKGCYIGQEVICRIDSMGSPKRKLVRLALDGDRPAPRTELTKDGKVVGWITSVSPAAPVALGYAKKRSNDVGTALTYEGGAATIAAVC